MKLQRFLLVLIRAMRMFLISIPVIVIYWQDHGLTMRDIFVLQVIFSVALIVFEVPSGYFADRFGRVLSIKLGSIVSTGGFFVYWAWPGFLGFAVAEVLLALGGSFLSGSIEAHLNESIDPKERVNANRKWQGWLMTAGNVSEAAAAIAAGIIASRYGIEAVLLVQVFVLAAATPLAWFLTETRNTAEVKTPPLMKILQGSFYRNKRLQALNLYAAGISAGTLTMVWFTQPHWRELGVDILYFGYLWAILQVMVAFGASLADVLERKLRFRTLFVTAGVLMTVGYLAMAGLSESLCALLVLPIFWFIRGVTHPLIVDFVQRESKDEEKATVLSINKLATRLVFSLFSPFLGWAVDLWSFATAFTASAIVFGIVVALGLVLLLQSYRK